MGLIQGTSAEHDKKVEHILSLLKMLQMFMANSSDRVETLIELVRDEFIPVDMYNKMVDNEMVGIIKDIEDALYFYKGLN